MNTKNISGACGRAIENALQNLPHNFTTNEGKMKINLRLESSKPTDGGSSYLESVTAVIVVPVAPIILSGKSSIDD